MCSVDATCDQANDIEAARKNFMQHFLKPLQMERSGFVRKPNLQSPMFAALCRDAATADGWFFRGLFIKINNINHVAVAIGSLCSSSRGILIARGTNRVWKRKPPARHGGRTKEFVRGAKSNHTGTKLL